MTGDAADEALAAVTEGADGGSDGASGRCAAARGNVRLWRAVRTGATAARSAPAKSQGRLTLHLECIREAGEPSPPPTTTGTTIVEVTAAQ